MGHKRKRQAELAAPDEPVPKKQAVEQPKSNGAADRRQKRSERKSKKTEDSKRNASRTKPKNKSKYESKKDATSVLQTAQSPELVQATPVVSVTGDRLAEGQDFVPLTDTVNTTDLSRSTRKPSSKPKKASPEVKRKRIEARAEEAKTNNESEPSQTQASDSQTPNTRFIVFVGNLPYTSTTAQITSHFHKLEPTSIRHPTDKSSGKSKGYAFLEFDNYSAMKTCLKVYHHSMFDPERTSKLPADAFDENGLEIAKLGQEKKGSGRRINVELTVGGGGKGQGRQEKIRVKNTRLEEQRDRRRDAEMKAEKAKNRKRGISEVNQIESKEKADDGRGDIHPSRLRRVKG